MSQILETKLEKQFDVAKEAFQYGSFHQCIGLCRSIIADFLVLTPGPQTIDITQRQLRAESIPIRALELILRAQFELGLTDKVLETVNIYFQSPSKAPYNIIVLLCSILSIEDQHDTIVTVIEKVLHDRVGSLLPDEYEALCTILVKEGYIPTNNTSSSLIFIASNRRLATNIPLRTSLLSLIEDHKESLRLKGIEEDETEKSSIQGELSSKPTDGASSTSLSDKNNVIGEWPIQEESKHDHDRAKPDIPPSSLQWIQKVLSHLRNFTRKIVTMLGFDASALFNSTHSIFGKFKKFLWSIRHAVVWSILLYTCFPLLRFIYNKSLSLPGLGFALSEIQKGLKIAFTIGTGGHM